MKTRLSFLAAAAIVALASPAAAQFPQALDESQATSNEGKASQQRIDQLDEQTQRALNDYRANLKQLEAARRYNASLERQIEAQMRQIERLRIDLENVSGLQKAVTPLMEDMVATFEKMVEADLPFDMEGEEGRKQRVERLKSTLNNPELSAAQRYRLIVEAYQIENEFGRTLGAYTGQIVDDGQERSGEFLRVGRIALIFKTPDDSVLKIYDRDEGGWVNLAKSYLPDVRLGLRMANEQTAPSLLPVPVKPPVESTANQ
jgi:TolA-binding protein